MTSLRAQLKRFRILVFLLVIVIIVLVFVAIRSRSTGTVLPAQTIETVQKRTVEQVVSVEGNIDSQNDRLVYAPSQGKIIEVRVSVGQTVSADDVLAIIQVAQGTVTRDVDIKSPIDAKVAEVNVNVNDIVVNITSPLFRVYDDTRYEINSSINENDISLVAVGQKVKITIPAISMDITYFGIVSFVAPSPNSTSGAVTYLVKTTPDSLPAVRLGMSADLDITTARVDDVIAVPESFISEKNGGKYVKLIQWLSDDHSSYQTTDTQVTTGLETDKYVEIRSGVREGDEILDPSYTVQRKSIFGI